MAGAAARVAFLGAALAHLALTAVVSLSIDTTQDEDPTVRAYHHLRWKLLTCWFNLIAIAYLPTRLYVEWRQWRGQRAPTLRRATDLVMTGLLAPVTLYADITFWAMFLTDPSLMGPPRVFAYLPNWTQHSLHTVSAVVVLVDLTITPRRIPASKKPHLLLLTAFVALYTWVLCSNLLSGVVVYSLQKGVGVYQHILMGVGSYMFCLVLFKIQWLLIGAVWDKKINTE